MPGTWKTQRLVDGLHKAAIEGALSEGWEPFAVCPHGAETYVWFRKHSPAETTVEAGVHIDARAFDSTGFRETVSKMVRVALEEQARVVQPDHHSVGTPPMVKLDSRPDEPWAGPEMSEAEKALRACHAARMEQIRRSIAAHQEGIQRLTEERGRMLDELYALKRLEGWTP
ncbi:hypothetical protein [Roseococcus pinisoli]|uniref:Uncharacterized protein n=1 Tax=Roseococcus pinisoli TaxID=2835040 RepID=A0ABS5QH91_9PROT|nr:hypothetical protein [Roseococcus pinisoli]MBS7812302.1 hypothetical protein [Roseococcus pinisoli]